MSGYSINRQILSDLKTTKKINFFNQITIKQEYQILNTGFDLSVIILRRLIFLWPELTEKECLYCQ